MRNNKLLHFPLSSPQPITELPVIIWSLCTNKYPVMATMYKWLHFKKMLFCVLVMLIGKSWHVDPDEEGWIGGWGRDWLCHDQLILSLPHGEVGTGGECIRGWM